MNTAGHAPDLNSAVERIAAGSPADPFWAEHRSRYLFARRYVKGRRVLDVACGDGWGGAVLMAAGASSVLGIDASAEAITHAQRHLVPGFRVKRADAEDLPIPDRSIDVVVSFETLEHLREPDRFLDETVRVLTEDGTMLLSTPNAFHSKPRDGVPVNPFHTHEYTPAELTELLSRRFARVELLGQRVHPRFRPCPYWERAEIRSSGVAGHAASLRWKLLARLPRPWRDRVAMWLTGHPLIPGELDFVFEAARPADGHVLLAICHQS